MPTYISLLRGINVSGQKKILMADLKLLYESLGFQSVTTYIQSGNVVFNCHKNETQKLERLIFDKIKKEYGFEVPNLILTPTDIEQALTNNPYPNVEKPYFIFLSALPKPANSKALQQYSFENEFYELKEKVVYAHFPNGAGRAKMTLKFFEKHLKVVGTTRNLRTTQRLLEMAQNLS